MNSARHDNVSYSIYGCNMAMRRSLAERIGFFDENLGAGKNIPASEDIDYIFRCYLQDVVIEYVPDMAVIHFHGRKTFSEGRNLLQNYAVGEGALYAKYLYKYPNFCRMFIWNLKDALREIASGKNRYKHNIGDIDFSYRDKIRYNILGAFKYWTMRKSA